MRKPSRKLKEALRRRYDEKEDTWSDSTVIVEEGSTSTIYLA